MNFLSRLGSNFKIGTRLGAGFALVLALLGAVAGLGYLALSNAELSTTRLGTIAQNMARVGAINASFGANPVINFSAAADGSGFILDNVIANAVPEPTTLLLLATGAGLLGASQRRRKRAEARGPDQGDGGQAI